MSKKFTLIVGILVFTVFILIIVFGFNHPAHSDISMDQATKIYEVPFSEWVQVMLHVSVAMSADDYYVITGVKNINNKVRFCVSGAAYNTAIGRKFFKEGVPKIKESIATMCKMWTVQGYPISLNDFEINIEAPY